MYSCHGFSFFLCFMFVVDGIQSSRRCECLSSAFEFRHISSSSSTPRPLYFFLLFRDQMSSCDEESGDFFWCCSRISTSKTRNQNKDTNFQGGIPLRPIGERKRLTFASERQSNASSIVDGWESTLMEFKDSQIHRFDPLFHHRWASTLTVSPNLAPTSDRSIKCSGGPELLLYAIILIDSSICCWFLLIVYTMSSCGVVMVVDWISYFARIFRRDQMRGRETKVEVSWSWVECDLWPKWN